VAQSSVQVETTQPSVELLIAWSYESPTTYRYATKPCTLSYLAGESRRGFWPVLRVHVKHGSWSTCTNCSNSISLEQRASSHRPTLNLLSITHPSLVDSLDWSHDWPASALSNTRLRRRSASSITSKNAPIRRRIFPPIPPTCRLYLVLSLLLASVLRAPWVAF